ncbi:zinc-finger of the MIZ type in Nse subunit-domain-containing protein [Pestalotiopsis sp. NC0098]|nr:zinc-finger of the MIZ type in Nse subunit-domain-containing protein [Pestalotiopsis sp. NC0098]
MSRRGLLANGPGSSRTGSARPGTATSSSRGGGRTQQDKIQMPEYEPPSFALDTNARHALAELSRNTTDARRYGAELEKSVRLLGESVGEVNDRLQDRKETLAARLEKRKDSGDEEDEDTKALRAAVDMLRQEAPGLTRRCDEGVRQVIDWMVEMEDARTAAANTVQEVEQESIGVETRAQAAQARANWRAQERERRIDSGQLNDDDEEEEEEKDQDEEEDADNDVGERLKGPLKRLRENKARLQADYEGKTPYQRYGLNNDYIQFKKQWHEAAHRDGKPLPDASKWFSSRNHDSGEDEEEEEEDDDLIVAREKKDIRCPLSLVIMQEPFTSSKCNHTFEKTAIMEFLRSQPGRSTRCPQTGCSKEVSIRDFSLDHSMLRQIKRAQRQEANDDDDDDDEEEDEANNSMRVTSHRKIKKEPRGRGRSEAVEEEGDEEEEE